MIRMALLDILLICICLILLGAVASKPVGWVVVGLSVILLLLSLLGGNGFLAHGR